MDDLREIAAWCGLAAAAVALAALLGWPIGQLL